MPETLAAIDVGTNSLHLVVARTTEGGRFEVVTREKEMDLQLAVHERLSSIGLLTAGVAHEINNPLEGIGNHVKLLGRPDLAPEDRARHLDLVRHGFERIRDIVRDLLRFAEIPNLKRIIVSHHEMVESDAPAALAALATTV